MISIAILSLAVTALAASAQLAKRSCSPLEIVIARGTTEPQGYGVIGGGTRFVDAVKAAIPGSTAYDVKYPAATGSESQKLGVEDVLKYFQTKPKECPQQMYVLSGYSQGGLVMHRAADKLDKSLLKSRIVAAVTFGDHGQQATKEKPIYDSPFGPIPVWPSELDGRIKFNCASGDPACTPGSTNFLAHLTYNTGDFVDQSAKFVQQQWQQMKISG